MKKLALLCGLLASTASFAETKTEQAPVKDTRPMVVMRVFDISSKVPRPLEENVISLKAKHQLCWFTLNVPVKGSNSVVETFNTPAPSKYTTKYGSVTSSANNTIHIISTQRKAENNQVGTCWQFDKKTDPVGQYQLSIKVNNLEFPVLPFEIKE